MLQRRLEEQDQSRLTAKDVLLLRLNKQYPEDVGVLAALFLNLLTLRKGQVSTMLHEFRLLRNAPLYIVCVTEAESIPNTFATLFTANRISCEGQLNEFS